MQSLKELIEGAFFHSWQRTAMVLGGLILALALPITIILTQQQQDLRQRAADLCGGCDPGYTCGYTQRGWFCMYTGNNTTSPSPVPVISPEATPIIDWGQTNCGVSSCDFSTQTCINDTFTGVATCCPRGNNYVCNGTCQTAQCGDRSNYPEVTVTTAPVEGSSCVGNYNNCSPSGAKCCTSGYSCVASPQGVYSCLPASTGGTADTLNKTFRFTFKAVCPNGNMVSDNLKLKAYVITADEDNPEPCAIRTAIGITGSGAYNESIVISFPKNASDTTTTTNACLGHVEKDGALWMKDTTKNVPIYPKSTSGFFSKHPEYNAIMWDPFTLPAGNHTIEFYAQDDYCSGNDDIQTPPAATPTNTPTLTPTPTTAAEVVDNNPSPSLTQTPPDETLIALAVSLPGIGSNAPVEGLGSLNNNETPKRSTREVEVLLKNEQGANVTSPDSGSEAPVSGTLTFDPATFTYKGIVSLGNLPTGNYQIFVRLDNTLYRQSQGFPLLTLGQTTAIPSLKPNAGDIDRREGSDDELTLDDYNLFIACFKETEICTPQAKIRADLDDNEIIDTIDLHLMQRGFLNVKGDSH